MSKKSYLEQSPDERALGADTIRIELVDRMYEVESKLYRFLAMKNGKILDVVELDCLEWGLREAIDYVRKDRWLSAGDAELDLTEAAAYYTGYYQ